MKQTVSTQSSYAALFDPAFALAVAERAAQWKLPRHFCHPLDRYSGRRAGDDQAAFDAAVDLAPIPEEVIPEDVRGPDPEAGDGLDTDFENEDDL
jgi:hypothetical protein